MQAEIGILGGGFASSLAAVLLSRVGRDVVLLDPSRHPRFRIGESSTPTADLLLRQLAERYEVAELTPLTRYGDWQSTYPHLRCGCKRGFSYFRHHPGEPFQPRSSHDNELLVAASTSDQVADTHWVRADIDQFFFELAKRHAAAWEDVQVQAIERTESGWRIDAQQGVEHETFDVQFLIDGSGAAGRLGQTLGLARDDDSLLTNTRAIYTHCRDIASWSDLLSEERGGADPAYPFDPDLAAQHHILDEGWVWMLRFDNDLTSVGLVLKDTSVAGGSDPETCWHKTVARYPSLSRLMRDAQVSETPGRWIATDRLQRIHTQASGDNWAMLPAAAGFVDPLHSTGIAHSVFGVARLVELLDRNWNQRSLKDSVRRYGASVLREIRHLDRLVAGCYQSSSFSRFVDFSMLYFVAAVRFETRCKAATTVSELGEFLGADDRELEALLPFAMQKLNDSALTDQAFRDYIYAAIAPLQGAGLGRFEAGNMYHHTAAE